MDFVKLYKDNQEAVKKALMAMWCSDDHHSPTQKLYIDQIADLIDKELFTSADFMPLVQCMDRYESINHNDLQKVNDLVGGLWKKSFDPYKHQAESWKELANGKSIVVTTGTGSGKTECFMLPLVSDLKKQNQFGKIQAIFLYPLNALMEDQKDRLQELLNGTQLRFAVYNGNLPNDNGSFIAKPELRRQLQLQIAEEKRKYPSIVPTREEMWNNPPEIILTNPTMLEYMLLRNKDQHMFTKDSLRWIVIDEAHTYTGAGAAELAMLIRRVLDAFDIQDANTIRFATSSATIGNASSTAQKNASIVKFIKDITGSSNVVAIDGDRKYKVLPTDSPELQRCRSLLNINDYVRLDELFPNSGETIEQKLEQLDALCNLSNPLKAKLHLFYRVPTNGLRVRLTETVGHALKVRSFAPLQSTGAPYLELMRCEHCGEFFAVGETVDGAPDKYMATSSSDGDIFDFDSSHEKSSKLIFSFTDKQISPQDKDGNTPVVIKDDTMSIDSSATQGAWHIIRNVQKCCPCCGERLIGKASDNPQDEDADSDESMPNARAYKVSGSFISRSLAPSILPNLMKSSDPNLPHDGQQYISFVDSRQGAAKASMQQNLDEERLWIYSRIYHELLSRQKNVNPIILEKRAELASKGIDQATIDMAFPLTIKPYIEWNEIFSLLDKDKDSDRLAYQFVNKRELSDEYDALSQTIEREAKSKYLYSAMIEQLGKRPKKAAAPETLGLFVSYYPKLEIITKLPFEVEEFNNKFGLNIGVDDWKNLMKMYLDTYVRSNESLYLKNGTGTDCLDIKNCCKRFGTTKPPRRPVHEPVITDDKQGRYLSTIVLLATLIDPSSPNINDTIYDHKDDINPVLKAFWDDLRFTAKIIQESEYYNGSAWVFDKDKDANNSTQYRMNVADIAFKLYDTVWMCDSRMAKEKNPSPRPVDTLFIGYAPYIINNKAQLPLGASETWEPYPYILGLDNGRNVTGAEILSWAKTKRVNMCDANLWGDEGAFSNILEKIHSYPEIFIQAEHTAQVDKLIAKHSQELFKAGKINILACSTTMEMGVDLGNLEMVLMTSIPPHPSNYKQRAGRSGRNDNPKSACITLCSSDSVGLRTILNPMENLINRPMQTPFVDLKSPQVIQRHANAYLFRLSKIFFNNARGNANNLDQEIIEFFTPFAFGNDNYGINYELIIDRDNPNTQVFPCNKLGDERRTKYYEFRIFLDNCDVDPDNHLKTILKDTVYDSCETQVIQNCKDDIKRCYEELSERADELAGAYDDAKTMTNANSDRVDTPYGFYLRHKYSELLSKNLIAYFATNRFTPNANMPVNVVEFDISLGKLGKYDRYKTNNPSYALQQAISQYSPGNTIVIENRTAVVRGLLYTGMFRANATFKKIYSDGENTVVGEERKSSLPHLLTWPVNGHEELTMIEPYAFIPDINETYSRVVEDAPYTQVSAQLVGAGSWADLSKSSSLYSVRNNRDCGDANILYYNEGIGFGYCFCTKCGKAILETRIGRGRSDQPQEMDDQTRDVNGTPENFHYMINRKKTIKGGKGLKQECNRTRNSILRNVIIGGMIQTDYSEIRIRKDERDPWIADRNDLNLLITLGIVFTQAFVDSLGKDRQDVDFAITPNGHLCIFDTNPGGSGYSNQLVNMSTMQSVIDASEKVLNKIKTKDELIDKYTKRYYEQIDINAAKAWIKAERIAAAKIPAEVSRAYPTAVPAVFEDILSAFAGAPNVGNYIFVDSNWKKWLYQDNNVSPTLTWRARVNELRTKGNRKNLCVVNPPAFIIRPAVSVLGQINDWADIVSSPISMPVDLYPLALVNGKFYFTNQVETGSMNYLWGRGNVFCVNQSQMPKIAPNPVSLAPLPTSVKFTLDMADAASLRIKSTELASKVTAKMPALLNEFLDHCSKQDGNLEIIYQDEHLKSAMGIVTTLQFAEWFIAKIGKPFSITFLLEEYYDKPTLDITRNMANHNERDTFLEDMLDRWENDINTNFGINGTHKLVTGTPGSLPHWREFKLVCGKKELILYPNGGIINEWHYDRYNDSTILMKNTISYSNVIPLYRKNNIMYDAEIKDC